jgi:histidinol-phosphate/aromatic aminotransferase/cobyric acid decarboxylase-like protein
VDYASFRRWRDGVVALRPGVRRLDCMNPVKALASWVEVGKWQAAAPTTATASDIAAVWSTATGHQLPPGEHVLGRGVRPLLEAVMRSLPAGSGELWLPDDVYPVYWQLARATGRVTRSFSTLGRGAWAFLTEAGLDAVAVLPVPLSPLGRWLAPKEAAQLEAWLWRAKDRLLVIDAAYTYDFATSRAVLRPLLDSGRCVALWSFSKSWLRPDMLGIARAPQGWAATLQGQVELPSANELAAAITWLGARPDLPSQQAVAFQRQWPRLSETIRAAIPDWQPPTSGYFSTVTISHRTLLADHGILAVPASVFGATDADVSIVSCLHDLAMDQRRERLA